MKKVLLLLLAGWLLISFTGGAAQASSPEPFVSGDWICVKNTDGLTLKDYLGNETDLTIPSELEGMPVTQLGSDLFMGNMRLKNVTIPRTVTVIGTNAFNSCTALESVELSPAITKIDSGTFRHCTSMTSIDLPNAVKTIGSFAFANCFELTQIYLNNVTSVGESAFENCEKLAYVYTGTNKLSSVGAFAFRNTSWLDHKEDEFVMIGKGVLLRWNGSGTEVTVPWGTAMISGTFAENDTIEKVTLPDTVRNIGQYAFRNAVNLKSVNVPQYTTTVGAGAFEGCRSLTELELPDTVTSIGASAFRNCERLKKFGIPPKVKTINAQTFADCPALRELMIPETVTKIDKNAFLRSEHLVLKVVSGSAGAAFAEENSMSRRFVSGQ